MLPTIRKNILRNITKVDHQIPGACCDAIHIGIQHPKLNVFHIGLLKIGTAQRSHYTCPFILWLFRSKTWVCVIGTFHTRVIGYIQSILGQSLPLGDILIKDILNIDSSSFVCGNIIVTQCSRPLIGIKNRIYGIPGHFCPTISRFYTIDRGCKFHRWTSHGPSKKGTDIDQRLRPLKIVQISSGLPFKIGILGRTWA